MGKARMLLGSLTSTIGYVNFFCARTKYRNRKNKREGRVRLVMTSNSRGVLFHAGTEDEQVLEILTGVGV